jgi:hypothetical protein
MMQYSQPAAMRIWQECKTWSMTEGFGLQRQLGSCHSSSKRKCWHFGTIRIASSSFLNKLIRTMRVAATIVQNAKHWCPQISEDKDG